MRGCGVVACRLLCTVEKAEEVGNGEGQRGARSDREKGKARLVVGVDPELCRGFGDGDLLEAGELGTNRQ